MSKFQINFYTFYQILEGWAGNKQQSIISKHIKKITFSLEKEINSLEREITLFHAKVVNEMTGSKKTKVDLIGFHGQTVFHDPKIQFQSN